jgi:hypothetical protein
LFLLLVSLMLVSLLLVSLLLLLMLLLLMLLLLMLMLLLMLLMLPPSCQTHPPCLFHYLCPLPRRLLAPRCPRPKLSEAVRQSPKIYDFRPASWL